MPNWCENKVEVFGSEEDMKKFKEFVSDGDSLFSFQKIKPIPEELKDTTSPSGEPNVDLIHKYGVDNWYDWCTNNWGVKWDVQDVELQEGGDTIYYHFDTPWGPPREIYHILVDEFPDVSIVWFYDEPGMMVAGYLGAEGY